MPINCKIVFFIKKWSNFVNGLEIVNNLEIFESLCANNLLWSFPFSFWFPLFVLQLLSWIFQSWDLVLGSNGPNIVLVY